MPKFGSTIWVGTHDPADALSVLKAANVGGCLARDITIGPHQSLEFRMRSGAGTNFTRQRSG
jgi:hypothetical protein